MATQTHTSPNGQTRFEVRCELSHYNFGIMNRSYAGVTIYREIQQAAAFNIFDAATWFSRTKFVRAGNPGGIVVAMSFDDVNGTDIGPALNLGVTNTTGHFGRFALFIYWGGSGPPPIGNDARSVRNVRLTYRLPWEQADRNLNQRS